ncbi:MAG: diacylglycerol kinase family protein [Candidatus Promineifilaceae bacterium]
MKKAKIILNPYANRWGAKKRVTAVEEALRAADLDFDMVLIPEPHQGTRLAFESVEAGYDIVIAAGGDGTVNEVVNGLIQAAGNGPTIPFGILPIGTGNDFNDMAHLPRNLSEAARAFAAGKTRQIDAGQVTFDGKIHYFDNNCAAAMEPLVTIENERLVKLSGNIRYIVALVKALAKLKAWDMKITWEGGGYEGPTYLLSICNSPRTGGLFPMAPDASLSDGLFDFVLAPEISKLTVLVVLARLFRGTHIHHKKVTYGRTPNLTIVSKPGSPIHADGEVLTEAASEIRYDILPGKITLLSPE